MKRRALSQVLRWGVGPIALAGLAALLGHFGSTRQRDPLTQRIAALSEAERRRLEALPSLGVANAVWALGDVEAVKRMVRTELDAVPESDGPRRARALIRLGIVDTNPDGQAAVFAQACMADERVCDQLPQAAAREAEQRLVAPGNRVPLSLLGGHPAPSWSAP